MREGRQLIRPTVIILAVMLTGTLGYMVIEGFNVLDAVYMTVTTMATVGFGEIHPLSPTGRLFTIFLIILGVGGALYLLTAVACVAAALGALMPLADGSVAEAARIGLFQLGVRL